MVFLHRGCWVLGRFYGRQQEGLRVLPLSYVTTDRPEIPTDLRFGVLPIPGPGHSADLSEHTDDKKMLITGDLFSHGTWNFLIMRGFASVKLYRFSVMTAHVRLTGWYKYRVDAFPPNWLQNRDQNEAVKTWRKVRRSSGISWLHDGNKEVESKPRWKQRYKPWEGVCSQAVLTPRWRTWRTWTTVSCQIPYMCVISFDSPNPMGRGDKNYDSQSQNEEIEIKVTSQGQQQVSGMPNSKANAISTIPEHRVRGCPTMDFKLQGWFLSRSPVCRAKEMLSEAAFFILVLI